MIIYIGDKWFDEDKLEKLDYVKSDLGSWTHYYLTEKGTIIYKYDSIGGSHWGIVEKDSDEYQELQKYINPNPEDEL